MENTDCVLVAVEHLGYKCTVAEVVAESGLPVDVVEMQMAALMRDSGGIRALNH